MERRERNMLIGHIPSDGHIPSLYAYAFSFFVVIVFDDSCATVYIVIVGLTD